MESTCQTLADAISDNDFSVENDQPGRHNFSPGCIPQCSHFQFIISSICGRLFKSSTTTARAISTFTVSYVVICFCHFPFDKQEKSICRCWHK